MLNTAFSYSLIVVVLALAVFTGVLSFERKDPFLRVCTGAFILIAVSFKFFLYQLSLGSWAGIMLPNTLFMLAHIFFPWSVRMFVGQRPSWPLRYWLYISGVVLVFAFFTFMSPDYLRRAVTVSMFVIVCTIEYLLTVLSNKSLIDARVRIIAVSCVGFATLLHAVRILLLLSTRKPSSAFMLDNDITTVTFLGTIFYLVLWAGIILLLDNSKILQQVRESNSKLAQLALQDELTGLLNRHSLDQTLHNEIERQDRYLVPLSAVMIDVDHFKSINDNFGHDNGDRVLVEVARRLRETIREADMLFRWGGEEFLVLAVNTGISGAAAVAEKIRKNVAARPLEPAGTVTVSCGVAERHNAETMEHWFEQIDKALYRAKKNGRNRVEIRGGNERSAFEMLSLNWNSEWNSGHPEIDREHRELLRRSGILLNLSLSGASVDSLTGPFEEVIRLIREHFSHEETILARIGYDDLENHRKIHQALTVEADMLLVNYQNQIIEPSYLFHLLVDKIVTEHLVKVDSQYFSRLSWFLHAKNKEMPAIRFGKK